MENEITLTFNYTGEGQWTVSYENGYPLVIYFPISGVLDHLKEALEGIEDIWGDSIP